MYSKTSQTSSADSASSVPQLAVGSQSVSPQETTRLADLIMVVPPSGRALVAGANLNNAPTQASTDGHLGQTRLEDIVAGFGDGRGRVLKGTELDISHLVKHKVITLGTDLNLTTEQAQSLLNDTASSEVLDWVAQALAQPLHALWVPDQYDSRGKLVARGRYITKVEACSRAMMGAPTIARAENLLNNLVPDKAVGWDGQQPLALRDALYCLMTQGDFSPSELTDEAKDKLRLLFEGAVDRAIDCGDYNAAADIAVLSQQTRIASLSALQLLVELCGIKSPFNTAIQNRVVDQLSALYQTYGLDEVDSERRNTQILWTLLHRLLVELSFDETTEDQEQQIDLLLESLREQDRGLFDFILAQLIETTCRPSSSDPTHTDSGNVDSENAPPANNSERASLLAVVSEYQDQFAEIDAGMRAPAWYCFVVAALSAAKAGEGTVKNKYYLPLLNPMVLKPLQAAIKSGWLASYLARHPSEAALFEDYQANDWQLVKARLMMSRLLYPGQLYNGVGLVSSLDVTDQAKSFLTNALVFNTLSDRINSKANIDALSEPEQRQYWLHDLSFCTEFITGVVRWPEQSLALFQDNAQFKRLFDNTVLMLTVSIHAMNDVHRNDFEMSVAGMLLQQPLLDHIPSMQRDTLLWSLVSLAEKVQLDQRAMDALVNCYLSGQLSFFAQVKPDLLDNLEELVAVAKERYGELSIDGLSSLLYADRLLRSGHLQTSGNKQPLDNVANQLFTQSVRGDVIKHAMIQRPQMAHIALANTPEQPPTSLVAEPVALAAAMKASADGEQVKRVVDLQPVDEVDLSDEKALDRLVQHIESNESAQTAEQSPSSESDFTSSPLTNDPTNRTSPSKTKSQRKREKKQRSIQRQYELSQQAAAAGDPVAGFKLLCDKKMTSTVDKTQFQQLLTSCLASLEQLTEEQRRIIGRNLTDFSVDQIRPVYLDGHYCAGKAYKLGVNHARLVLNWFDQAQDDDELVIHALSDLLQYPGASVRKLANAFARCWQQTRWQQDHQFVRLYDEFITKHSVLLNSKGWVSPDLPEQLSSILAPRESVESNLQEPENITITATVVETASKQALEEKVDSIKSSIKNSEKKAVKEPVETIAESPQSPQRKVSAVAIKPVVDAGQAASAKQTEIERKSEPALLQNITESEAPRAETPLSALTEQEVLREDAATGEAQQLMQRLRIAQHGGAYSQHPSGNPMRQMVGSASGFRRVQPLQVQPARPAQTRFYQDTSRATLSPARLLFSYSNAFSSLANFMSRNPRVVVEPAKIEAVSLLNHIKQHQLDLAWSAFSMSRRALKQHLEQGLQRNPNDPEWVIIATQYLRHGQEYLELPEPGGSNTLKRVTAAELYEGAMSAAHGRQPTHVDLSMGYAELLSDPKYVPLDHARLSRARGLVEPIFWQLSQQLQRPAPPTPIEQAMMMRLNVVLGDTMSVAVGMQTDAQRVAASIAHYQTAMVSHPSWPDVAAKLCRLVCDHQIDPTTVQLQIREFQLNLTQLVELVVEHSDHYPHAEMLSQAVRLASLHGGKVNAVQMGRAVEQALSLDKYNPNVRLLAIQQQLNAGKTNAQSSMQKLGEALYLSLHDPEATVSVLAQIRALRPDLQLHNTIWAIDPEKHTSTEYRIMDLLEHAISMQPQNGALRHKISYAALKPQEALLDRQHRLIAYNANNHALNVFKK